MCEHVGLKVRGQRWLEESEVLQRPSGPLKAGVATHFSVSSVNVLSAATGRGSDHTSSLHTTANGRGSHRQCPPGV